jgi:hypothetical protein
MKKMSLKKEVETKIKIATQAERWMAGYEMPVNTHNVISALMSLGYLSIRPQPRSVDRTTCGCVFDGEGSPVIVCVNHQSEI